LRLLQSGGVEYVVIGGLAMISHGSAYITKDVDLCYSRSEKNIRALAACCVAIHPYLRGAPPGLPFKFDAATIQAGLNFTLTTDLGDIDFLGEVSGIGSYEKVLAMSEEKDIYGMIVRVLSLEGLIAAKKAAGRTKDQLHLLELEELKKMRDEGTH
jgi:predicted nucleotidyltransferase